MSEKKRYITTARAGRFVAGQRNDGVGSVLMLTDEQAKYEVKNGTLILSKEQASAEPDQAASSDPVADAESARLAAEQVYSDAYKAFTDAETDEDKAQAQIKLDEAAVNLEKAEDALADAVNDAKKSAQKGKKK